MGIVEGVHRQVILGKLGLLRIGRRKLLLVCVINGPVLGKQFGLAVANIVGVRKAKIDQERIAVFGGFAFGQVFQHPFGVPSASGFVRASPLRGVVANGEQFVGRLVAIAPFAGSHRVVACPIEDCGHRELG